MRTFSKYKVKHGAESLFVGDLFEFEIVRKQKMLDGFLITPHNSKLAELRVVLHIQGVRYQESAISEITSPYDDEFNAVMINTLLSNGCAFARLGIHGVGRAGGDLGQESIKTRAEAITDFLTILKDFGISMSKVIISAQSQGCLVAIRALASNEMIVKKLTLVSPVLFSESAENARFGPDYTRELNVPRNYYNSLVQPRLKDIISRGTIVNAVWMEHETPFPVLPDVKRLWVEIMKTQHIPSTTLAMLYHNFTLDPPLTKADIAQKKQKPLNYLPAVRDYTASLIE